MSKPKWKHIKISPEAHAGLFAVGKKGETLDTIILRLLREAKKE